MFVNEEDGISQSDHPLLREEIQFLLSLPANDKKNRGKEKDMLNKFENMKKKSKAGKTTESNNEIEDEEIQSNDNIATVKISLDSNVKLEKLFVSLGRNIKLL